MEYDGGRFFTTHPMAPERAREQRVIVQFGDQISDNTGGLQHERAEGHMRLVTEGGGTPEEGVASESFKTIKEQVRNAARSDTGGKVEKASILAFDLKNERITPERRDVIVEQARDLKRDGGSIELLNVHTADQTLVEELVRSGIGVRSYVMNERMGTVLLKKDAKEKETGKQAATPEYRLAA